MPSEEIRVPTPAWSNPILEQNRFYIDIGLHLLLLALAISPFVVLYSKRKSPTGWLDLVLLVAALAGLSFATSYALSLLPDYQAVFVRGYAVLCFVVLVISVVMVIWKKLKDCPPVFFKNQDTIMPMQKHRGSLVWFPKNTLASHTEARVVTHTPLQPGQSMTITGQRPPCPSCKGYMNRAVEESGASIRYRWRQYGETLIWEAGN